MTPTMQLRFVERDSYSKNGEHFVTPHKIRVLQQFWEASFYEKSVGVESEWRDVPLETENQNV